MVCQRVAVDGQIAEAHLGCLRSCANSDANATLLAQTLQVLPPPRTPVLTNLMQIPFYYFCTLPAYSGQHIYIYTLMLGVVAPGLCWRSGERFGRVFCQRSERFAAPAQSDKRDPARLQQRTGSCLDDAIH